MDKQQKGKLGEDAVCAELEKRGHTILARNYRKRVGEIDIISKKDDFVVFTEVKTRKLDSMVSGVEAVDRVKQKKIILTADIWLSENPCELQPRYDIAEVSVTKTENSRLVRIDIFEDAFFADDIYTVN